MAAKIMSSFTVVNRSTKNSCFSKQNATFEQLL